MLFWLLSIALCSAVAVGISIPLIRRYENGAAENARSGAIYNDQLSEVERERAAGSIGEQEAELAKIEIQRRLLANAKNQAVTRPLSPAWKTLALVSTAGFVILGSVNLYGRLGSPELAIAPPPAATASATPQQQVAVTQPQAPPADAKPVQVNAVISRLAEKLKQNPNDADGWRMLGWSYFNTQQYQNAADAYGKALALDPSSADYKSALAESIVQASDGIVTPKAQQLFAEVLAKDAKEARARFYDALAREQAGDQMGALDRWLSLLADAPLDAPWRDDVKQRITDLGKATGRDVTAALAVPSLPASNEQQLGANDKNAMVEGMIAKLAAKLEQNPKDRDGWAMMIRSLAVKGDKAGSEQALAKALEIFKDDPATIEGLKSVAQGTPANTQKPAAAGSSGPQISADQQAAIQALPAGDQQEMIKGMVGKLAARLEGNPNDPDGWIRLMRSYMVLQDQASAGQAKQKALAAFAADSANLAKIMAAAAELGVN